MRFILFHIIIFYCCLAAPAQQQQMIRMNKYTQTEGLSSFNIRKIILDKYGFVWVATQDGLNRFDGNHFTVYDKGLSKKGLLGFDVRDLMEVAEKNELFVLSATGGIDVINTVTGTVNYSLELPASDANVWNTGFVKMGDKLWISTSNGICIYNCATRMAEPSLTLPFRKNSVNDVFKTNKILKDRYHHIWCFVDKYGIAVYDPLKRELIKKIDLTELGLLNETVFNDAGMVDPDRLVICTERGMRRIRFDSLCNIKDESRSFADFGSLYSGEVYSMGVSPGFFYFGTNTGLFRLDATMSRYTRYEEKENEQAESWLNSIKASCTGADGSLWLGCKNGLAYTSLKVPGILSFFYNRAKGQKLDNVFSLLPLNEQKILIGLEHGLKIVDMSTLAFRTLDKDNSYYGLLRAPDNGILASNQRGTVVIKGDKVLDISRCYPEFAGLDNIQYNSLINYNDSVVVLGAETLNGILIWNYLRHHVDIISTKTSPGNISSNIVNSLFKDSRSDLWVLSDNIISIYNSRFQRQQEIRFTSAEDRSAIPYYFCMCETKEHYWVAAYGTGILRLNKDRQVERMFTVKDGLCNNGVYKIFNYQNRFLLISTNNGLSVFDLRQEKFYNFYQADGLHGNSFEENVGVLSDSVMYAGGLKGFSRIEPGKFTYNDRPPPVFFSGIKVETESGVIDTSNLLIKEFFIPSNSLQTTIGFSALSYYSPGRTSFAYKIRELSEDWIGLGNQHFVNLIGIGPGKYTLLVKASNEDGVWNNTPIQLVLHFLPKWYQTLWFKLVILVFLGGVFYALYRYRISQIKKQQQIRKEIASDLHDDIGGTLNALKVYSHLARKEPGKEEHLINIEESLTEATGGLRDMLWVLDDSQDTVTGILERIKKFASPLSIANDIHMTYLVEEHSVSPIDKTEKRNLLMIAKEAINNSIKYASCKTISVEFRQNKSNISLTIRDDGHGFDTSVRTEGHGLKNIRERAIQIHYAAKILSFPGNGTTIEITSL